MKLILNAGAVLGAGLFLVACSPPSPETTACRMATELTEKQASGMRNTRVEPCSKVTQLLPVMWDFETVIVSRETNEKIPVKGRLYGPYGNNMWRLCEITIASMRNNDFAPCPKPEMFTQ